MACRQVPVIENTQIAQVNSPPPPPPSLLPPQAEALRCALPASRPLPDCEAAQRVLQGCTFQQLASDLAYLQPLQQDALKVGCGGDFTLAASVPWGFVAWGHWCAGFHPIDRPVDNQGGWAANTLVVCLWKQDSATPTPMQAYAEQIPPAAHTRRGNGGWSPSSSASWWH